VSEPDDSFGDHVVDPTVIIGTWANETRVRLGRDEFTIDFVRRVPHDARSFLVARAIVSPVVAADLRDQIDGTWRRYSEWSMPEETGNG